MSRPAPIDPAALRPVLQPTLGESRTLPPEAYVSQEVFEWEQRHFFGASWVCLGRTDDLGRPGDQKAFRIGNEGILLVRDRDGALRGFYNVCRHRGHELLECGASRNLRAIKCPYHAWVFSLDGTLSGAPRFGDVPGFDKADYPLIPARVHEWRGWVFVNASGGGPEFMDHIGNLEELVAPWEPERMFVGASHDYVIAANWKTITENYHECYHCPSIHPALCEVSPPDSGENYPHTGLWVGGSMELEDFDPAYAAEFWDITNREDWLACESVQRGQTSMGIRRGPFARSEDEVHAFMGMVARGCLDGRAGVPPQVRQETAVTS